MSSPPLHRWLSNLRIGSKLSLIALIPFPIVAVLTIATMATMGILSGLRAYVTGEGLYSKYQKDAVFYLERFVRDGNEQWYERYRDSIAVPRGDGDARRELERADPDLAAATRGFRQGKNAAEDIPWMITLFRRFQGVSYMSEAIRIWTAADRRIVELVEIAQDVRQRVRTNPLGGDERANILRRIERLNAELILLEDTFSQTIGEAFRRATGAVFVGLLVIDTLLLAAGLFVARRIGRGIVGQVEQLRKGAGEIAAGDLATRVPVQSRDELGQMAEWFNDMATSVERAEAETRQTLSTLSATLESTADGILVLDLEGRIVAFNRKVTQIWGLPPDAIAPGKRIEEALYVADQLVNPEQARERFREVQADPEGESDDVLEFRDGRIVERYSQAQRIDGRSVGRVFSFRDVTERRRAEMDLVRSNKDLEQFAYFASHDLQEPLRTVASYVQLLKRRYQGRLDQDADEFIAFAVDGALRMQNLIKALLEYSRVGTRGQPLVETRSDGVLAGVIAQLNASIHSSGATLTYEALPVVLADAPQLELVFQNLLSNAIKFRGESPPMIHVSAQRDGCEWIFAVRDNGIGIAPEFAARIFIMFKRLHGPDRYPGTGIGLAICKKVIERHGGRIWVESEPGRGVTFFFSLPAI